MYTASHGLHQRPKIFKRNLSEKIESGGDIIGLRYKLGLTNSAELAKQEELLTKKRAKEFVLSLAK
ncbi:hypothetical protein ICE98_00117 [Lactococcus lactis]|nr:hypothetical protein [Lactococcus lactis]